MEKAFEIQKQVRDNTKTLQTYLTDLQNWEAEMKRKEAALNGEFEQDLPPVRSKLKKDRPVQVKKKTEKRISASDYKAWEKFDVDKACEEVDMENVGPSSLDGKKSQEAKQEKLREEAQYEKERGNNFVKYEKWDEAISCYNRCIELVKDDAIYYANRGLCYLKKESLHQAETDCSEALRLDPTYVKAFQRRATARERLGSLRAASRDLDDVLKLEPHNHAARKQLEAIKARMGTKGAKSKSSPSTTPTIENKPIGQKLPSSKITELNQPAVTTPSGENWRNGVGENVTVIKTVKKPPHLRSKRPLKSVPIQEIQLGKTSPEKPPTRLKIIEIEDSMSHGDSNNNSNKMETLTKKDKGEGDKSQESVKLVKDKIGMEKDFGSQNVNNAQNLVSEVNSAKNLVSEVNSAKNLVSEASSGDNLVSEVNRGDNLVPEINRAPNVVPPVNSVQFMAEWKYLKGNRGARSDYLSIIDPEKIPSIFENALESDVLSEVLEVLAGDMTRFRDQAVAGYLRGLCRVKRFSALAMFLSNSDKQLLSKLLDHCKVVENCTEEEIADLKNKYEL